MHGCYALSKIVSGATALRRLFLSEFQALPKPFARLYLDVLHHELNRHNMDNEDDLILEFIDKLINSPTNPGEIQICPLCKGTLHVWFAAYKRGKERLFGVQVQCDSCETEMALDYGGPLPRWLEVS